MADQLKLGLIGAGAIAQSYIEAVEDSPLSAWAGITDVRFDAAGAAAEAMGCKSYRTHEELIDEAGCDGVIICTPPATHAEIALFCIERGVPVLCEKPLAVDVASARALCEAAERKGVVMAMASKFRYADDIIRTKSLIASGVLGDILLFENAFTSRVDMSKRWNSDPAMSGGGVLIDNGTHSIDIARYLLGPVAEVLAVEGSRTQNPAVEDTVNLFLRTHSRVTATVDLSWTLNKESETFIRIYGTNGTILVGWRASKFRQTSSPDWIVFGKGYDKVAAFKHQVDNFCGRILGTEPPLISNEDAMASVMVIKAAYESLAQGGWVSVPAGAEVKPLMRARA